ncbi:hypothetical protein TEU_09985 [Thermococcus eurythermalis]|uniref:Uncharacterized protein n=1 Tax=Thermococcus eurythermalis TaxID=1505907 RepID=A0A097QVY1_9EURY|nr:hypothetical protein [Thermococcus eurythermalis]AIU70633.1 hypothetical protein TEU_09985 [Thermococcus eurythermalis]
MVESQKTGFRAVLKDGKLLLVECPSERVIYEFTIDDLADIIEFRYATPWNKSKDIIEKLSMIINDLVSIYSNVSGNPPSKEDIMKAVKLRMI